jgi:hypothetical protein
MEGKNNLRAQIEQLFRDNPRKSFGVSEIARQLNARRNTIHYHLKTLKTTGFLGQNSEGVYYLDAAHEIQVANKEGITNCRYHPHALNVDWCPFCGNPICERCLSNLPNGFIACQECKHEKMSSVNKIHYLVYLVAPILTCLFIVLGSNLFISVLLAAGIVSVMVKESIWIKASIKDRKEYFVWKRMVDDRPISVEIIQSLIQGKEMNSCKYHAVSLGINRCEACGSNTCAKCSRILTEFMTARLVCMECFWKRRHMVQKIFTGFLSIGLALFLLVFIWVTIITGGSIQYSFYVICGITLSLYGSFLAAIVRDWIKDEKKYVEWRSSINPG